MGLKVNGLRDAHGVLAGVTFEVHDGEVLAVVGPSGSGKTTLLRTIAGLHELARGRIEIDGRDCTHLPARARPTAMVAQTPALFDGLSVRENIAFSLDDAAMTDLRRDDLVDIAMATMQVTSLGGRRPGSLSGGQAQRVSLARTLVRAPRVLLLDEPLAHVEATMRQTIRKSLLTHVRRDLASAIHVTHEIDEACSVADRLLVLRDGGVAQLGTPREVYRRPASRFVAQLLGIPNILAAEAVQVANGQVVVEVGRSRLTLPGQARVGPCTVILPPGAIALKPASGAEVIGLRGQIIESVFARTYVVHELETEMGTLVAHEFGDPSREPGDVVDLSIGGGWVIAD